MPDPIGLYFQNAQLSMAAYANLTVSMSADDYKDALNDAGFTDALADQFVATYRIAADTLVDPGTGLSATLFQNISTGDKILAIRGTNPNEISDLIADGLLAAGEAATLNPQYLRLQLYYAELIAQGKLGPDERFTVTGHSLGGFLAQAFTVDHPTDVTHTYTYNAPGTGGIVTEVLQQLGVTSSTIPSTLITNVISTNGLSIAAGLGTQVGTPVDIFIEATGFNLSFHDHQIATATDALAFYDLVTTIDPTVEIATVTKILEAASATTAHSLEAGLDALRVLFLGDRTPTPPGPSGVGDLNREAYYNNLISLRSSLLTPNIYRLDSLVDVSSSTVFSQAKALTADGEAYRYALKELNPFVVCGVDYQVLHNQGDPQARPLDLYDAQTGHGTWTALALSDRAELLAKRLAVNVNDGGTVSTDTHYLDLQSGFEVGSTSSLNEVIFGDDRVGDVLVGHTGDDHLYGRDGADTIEGHGGNDYIEGGVGNDPLLSGGAGNDILLGQQGDDTLDGGADNDRLNGGLGNDRLEGGTGLDTYFYHAGQGQDTILDADKIGTIVFDNQTLVGGIRREGAPADTYRSPDGQFTFVKSGTNLVINGTLTLETFDFANGALGIKLADAGDLVDSTGPTINYNNGQPDVRYDGDATDNTPIFTAAANHEAYGYGGNDILDFEGGSAAFTHQIFGGDGHDELHGGAGPDRIYGEAGRDLILAVEGDDVIDGGADIDLIKGGLGQDVLSGGLGNDGLDGGSGDDILWGGDGDDVLSGESGALGATTIGHDYLDGEAGDDWVLGLRGDDVLYGGTGMDHLYGDQVPSTAPNFELAYPGLVTTLPGEAFTSVTGGADYLDGEDGDDYLQGDAGDDILLGGADHDELVGDDLQVAVIEEGADWLEGEDGNDTLIGGGGEDALFGGDGDDVLVGDYANNPTLGFDDTLDGGAGIDQLQGGGGHDLLVGGSENDTLFGEDGDDSLYGGTGDDQLQGGKGDDALAGEEGADLLFGQAGDDVLLGDEGNDQLSGGAGLDDLAGGAGDDVLFGNDDDDTLFGDEGHDELQGGAGLDTLVGDVGNDRLFGDAGADTLWGDEGADTLTGNTGNDLLEGGAGSDTYVFNLGDGQDVLFEETRLSDINTIQFGAGITQAMLTFTPDDAQQTLLIQVGAGGDSILVHGFTNTGVNGTGGIQSLSFGGVTAVSLADILGLPSGPVTGTSGNDVVRTGDGDDTIHAGAGNDQVTSNGGHGQLFGDAGDDVIQAGAGDDTLLGGTGDDVLVGGLGLDTYGFNAGDGSDSIVDGNGEGNRLVFGSGIAVDDVTLEVGVAGSLIIHTGASNDRMAIANFNPLTLTGSKPVESFEFADGTVLNYTQFAQRGFTWAAQPGGGTLNGSGFNDVMIGGPGNDYLRGLDGDDRLEGNGGEDSLLGGFGNDQLSGGDHDDEMFGGAGSDTLLGGAGDDYILGDGESGIGDGNDYFDGGAGQDFLADAEGSNTYIFGRGYGQEVFQNEDDFGGEDIDTIRLVGILPSDITVRQNENDYRLGFGSADDLEILVNGTSDRFILNYWVAAFVDSEFVYRPEFQMERIEFADGTIWSTADLIAHAQGVSRIGTEFDDRLDGTVFEDGLIGHAGNDYLTGDKSADYLDGGTGDDGLDGGMGSDTYVFGLGYGSDTIYEDLFDDDINNLPNDIDVIQLGAGITPDDVVLQADESDHLVLRIANTSAELTMNRFFWDVGYEVERIAFADGTVWDSLRTRATGMAITGTESNDTLFGTQLNDVLTGLGGADTLDGAAGPDQLVGGSGDDTYRFNRGSGQDVIQDNAIAGELNHLKFGFGISASDLVLTQTPGTLTLALEGTTDQVQLTGFDPAGVTGSLVVGSLDFVNGFQVSTAGFVAGQHTNGDDTIIGTADADVLVGNAGQDDLAGGAGDDVLIGGAGNDVYRFNIGDGVDAIDDRLTETNRLMFGAGITQDLLHLYAQGNILTIQVGTTGDAVKIAGFNINDLEGPHAIDQFEFADGTVETYNQLLTRGFDILGTDGNDTIVGTVRADRIIGGRGNDVLVGSSGGDTYVFNIGDGQDRIADSNSANLPSEVNAILFGSGILASDVTVLLDGFDLRVRVGMNGDAINLQNFWFGSKAVQRLDFFDGASIDITNILNTPLGTTANQTITGTNGNDTIFGGGGNDTLSGGAGNDTLVAGTGGTVTLSGGAGNDQLFAGSGTVATLSGGAGNNVLFGENSISARYDLGTGGGNNIVFASSGGNTYIINAGSSQNTIQVPMWLAAVSPGTVQFGGGYNTFDPRLSLGSLVIRYGTQGGELRIVDFDPNDVFAAGPVQRFEFTDRVLTYEDLLALGFDIEGTGGNDTLTGTNTTDRFLGLAGDDDLSGGEGTDTFTGGTGADALHGGAGHDSYVFNLGDGIDTIEDIAAIDEGNGIQFGAGIGQNDLTFTRDEAAQTLTIQVGSGGTDQLRLLNFDPTSANGSLVVETLAFADGSTVNLADLYPPNQAPIVATPLVDRIVPEDAPLNLVVPVDTFADADAGDVLTLSASLADGSVLPAWLSFDAATGTFTGTPDDAQVGTLDLRVTATDTGNLSVSDVFTLTVTNVNETPTVAVSLADQQAVEDVGFSFVVPSGTFADVDSGDALTYSATLADGTALPAWLSFDSITRTFSGTPGNAEVGTLALTVTATDQGSLNASSSFTLTIQNVNDAPTLVALIADQTAAEDSAFTYTIPSNTFADVDQIQGDVLTYSASLATGSPLPAWLSFNPTTRTLSGTPGPGDAGVLQIAVTARDTQAASTTDQFVLTVSGPLPQTLTGTTGNDVLTGGRGDDTLSGLAGNDTLNGGQGHDLLDGGTGTDRMQGGTGNDTYIVDVSGDVVTELANEGTDTVQSSITATLGANVENLTLIGVANLNGTGNALGNILTGNSGTNVLTGGAGNDTYIVGTGDTVVENAGGGIDTVQSAVAWTLSLNVENLTLTGTANINGTGSSANNVLVGNIGNNTLDGGSGNDTIDGGDGNDRLLGGSGDDTLLGGLGTDTLNAGSGNDVLNGGDGTDTLDAGSGDDQLLGGAGNDTLMGGSGADQFTGGTGNDTMTGGSGNDRYNFARGDGQDTIIDSDPFPDNQDRAVFGATIDPLDLVISRQANDLRVAIHGSSDQITVQNWYLSTNNRIETLQAGNGQTLLSTQVDQLIQAMAGFSAQTGLTWEQGIEQRPQDVQTVLGASWQ